MIVAIHGGPEAQATVNFNARFNYLINELGIALLEPNVRGSSGYGKTFLDLDNGVKREDSVKDIGALLDWIATDSRLDAKRVMVQGGSYGGYMVLASLVHYSDRLRGGIDVVGISDFVSFLGNTESYRRDLRRVEYGDERDPAVRAVLDKISPLANAGKIRAPLLVVHGKNDPRVPVSEAKQIVQRCAPTELQCGIWKPTTKGTASRAKRTPTITFIRWSHSSSVISSAIELPGWVSGRSRKCLKSINAPRSNAENAAFQNDLTASRLPRSAGRRRKVIRSSSAQLFLRCSSAHKGPARALCVRSERSKYSASSARYFAAPASASEESARTCVGNVDQMMPSCVRVSSSIAPDAAPAALRDLRAERCALPTARLILRGRCVSLAAPSGRSVRRAVPRADRCGTTTRNRVSP